MQICYLDVLSLSRLLCSGCLLCSCYPSDLNNLPSSGLKHPCFHQETPVRSVPQAGSGKERWEGDVSWDRILGKAQQGSCVVLVQEGEEKS